MKLLLKSIQNPMDEMKRSNSVSSQSSSTTEMDSNVCPDCGKEYKYMKALEKHLRLHKTNKLMAKAEPSFERQEMVQAANILLKISTH
jgi:Zinc finger, C2H2 type